MKSKHTPGPWTISKANSGRLVVRNETDGAWASVASLRNLAVDGTETTERDTFGKLRIKKHSKETVEANAHLIAAAPDLLEAVRAAYMVACDLDARGQYIDYPRGMAFDGSLSGGLRAAIAKAEGK